MKGSWEKHVRRTLGEHAEHTESLGELVEAYRVLGEIRQNNTHLRIEDTVKHENKKPL